MRKAKIMRKTKETDISLYLNLDGRGDFRGSSGLGFFDHCLDLFSTHGDFDLNLKAEGDLYVDNHHTVEDVGLVLGQALKEALGDKEGINRYGSFLCPMDESLSQVNIDLSGRPYLVYNLVIKSERLGDFESQSLKEFFYAFSSKGEFNLHINNLYGENDHHKIESVFKALGHALREAVNVNREGILSSKGSL